MEDHSQKNGEEKLSSMIKRFFENTDRFQIEEELNSLAFANNELSINLKKMFLKCQKQLKNDTNDNYLWTMIKNRNE